MLLVIIRTLILYTTVVLCLRIMGKRQIGELQPSELVVAIMISDVATVPIEALDIPLLSGIIPVLTLLLAEVITSYLSLKSRFIRKFIMGEPSVVIYNGVICEKELEKQRFNLNDLLEELRLLGLFDISDVYIAVLETSGKLSVIPKTSARSVTVDDMGLKNVRREGLPCTVIMDGRFNQAEVKRSGHSKDYIVKVLNNKGIKSPKDVFIASIDEEGEMFVQKKSNGKGDKT